MSHTTVACPKCKREFIVPDEYFDELADHETLYVACDHCGSEAPYRRCLSEWEHMQSMNDRAAKYEEIRELEEAARQAAAVRAAEEASARARHAQRAIPMPKQHTLSCGDPNKIAGLIFLAGQILILVAVILGVYVGAKYAYVTKDGASGIILGVLIAFSGTVNGLIMVGFAQIIEMQYVSMKNALFD